MDTVAIERLTRISIENPLLPEEYVPWDIKPSPDDTFVPNHLVSIYGLPIQEQVTPEQLREIGRHEAVQFMFSYAWSEALAIKFLGRELVSLTAETAETKFMYREIIEETRHQEMFSRAIEALNGLPIRPTGHHFFWSKVACRYLPSSLMYMAVIAGEFVADAIGREVQKDKDVYCVLRKAAELHQIEEGRHIYFAKKYLEDYTRNASNVMRTIYCITMALHMYFMITMYVKEEIFRRVGIADSSHVYEVARKNYRSRLAQESFQSAIDYAKDFNGFNLVSKFFWKWLLKVEIQ